MIVIKKSAFRIFLHFAIAFHDWANASAKSSELDILRQHLPPLDWELYVVAMVPGSMENSGRFYQAVGELAEHESTLRDGLVRFGCPAAASLVALCVDLWEGDKWAKGMTEEESDDAYTRLTDEIANKEDWSYSSIVRYLVLHHTEYSFSILPFCETTFPSQITDITIISEY